MKKANFAKLGLGLLTTIATSVAMACPGGNLIQILDSSKSTVIASYNKITGEMTARNRSFQVVKVQEVGQRKSNLCVDSKCEELIDMKDKTIRVTFEEQISQKRSSVVLKNITIGQQAMAKGMPRGLSPADSADQSNEIEISENPTLFSCSTKN